jgi:hypothetical protein
VWCPDSLSQTLTSVNQSRLGYIREINGHSSATEMPRELDSQLNGFLSKAKGLMIKYSKKIECLMIDI